jgi:hypothetical protein
VPDEDPADELYAAPLDEFVARRNALAKALRAEKRRDEAAAVAALRRPSAGAWALNQVERTDPERIGGFLLLVERFRAATDAAMAGDAQDLRAVQSESRPAIDDVVRAAMAAVTEAGRNASDDLRRTVADTLHAALVDPAVARDLQRGRLADDHAAPGFGFGVGGAEVTDLAVARAARRPKEESPKESKADAEARRAELRARREREREAERLERRAGDLERKAAEAEQRAVELRADADAARAEADAAATD